eukprot:gene2823-78_t
MAPPYAFRDNGNNGSAVGFAFDVFGALVQSLNETEQVQIGSVVWKDSEAAASEFLHTDPAAIMVGAATGYIILYPTLDTALLYPDDPLYSSTVGV